MSQTKAELIKGLNINASAPATALQIDASGNVNIDSNTLYVDATNNRVGIGTSSVTGTNTRLEVSNDSAEIKVSSTSAFNANFRGFRIGVTGDSLDYSGIRFQPNSGELRTEAGFATWGGFQTFYTNGLERLRITSAGLVGIGTTGPNKTLEVAVPNAISNYATIRINSPYYTTWDITNNSDLVFTRNVTEAFRCDAFGRLLVGTSSSATGGSSQYARLQVNGNSSGIAGVITVGANVASTAVGANQGVGYLMFTDNGAGQYAWIGAENDGTSSSSSDTPGRLVFSTTADGASTPTEAMRIDNQRNILAGGATDTNVGSGVGIKILSSARMQLGVTDSTNGSIGYSMYSTGAAAYRFYVGFGGTIFATSTTISAISDRRLKENIKDLDAGLNAILALKPRKFDWKEGFGNTGKNVRGFIAQEVEEIFPDLIDEWEKGENHPEGEEPYKSVRQDLIPVLVKAIQEQQVMIAELQTEVEALKGA